MRILHKINTFVARLESWILVVIVLVMVTLSFTQVILRNVFDQGVLWGDIFLRHLVLWVGFIGASLATKEEKHINIDVFGRLMHGKGKLIVQGFVYFFAVCISWLLTDASWNFVLEEKQYETILFNGIASWYFQIIIPIGFALMTLRFALIGVDRWISAFTFKVEEK
jgi:TRAP-type C4-dicarboxylate transport system permease small subunit